ncbi:hypothetical protein ABPG77_003206 [Micractinium sp. CCAP 211/92]
MMIRPAGLLLAAVACLAVCGTADAAAKCTVVPPNVNVTAAGVAGWNGKSTRFANAVGLAFAAGELFEADPLFARQRCPPHTGETPSERMANTILGVCTKLSPATQSNKYRVSALIRYPCKGRAASTLKLKSGTYKCPKNRWCVNLYITADAPFWFDFASLNGAATSGEGEGEGYGGVLGSILDLNIKTKRFT